jgi:hypothetical protein
VTTKHRITTTVTPLAPASAEYLREADLEAMTGIPCGTWRQWRYLGRGPRYIKAGGGRHVLYPAPGVVEWLAAGEVEPEAARPATEPAKPPPPRNGKVLPRTTSANRSGTQKPARAPKAEG